MCHIYLTGCCIPLQEGGITIFTGVDGRRMAHLQEEALIVIYPAGPSWYEIKTLFRTDLYCNVIFHYSVSYFIFYFV